MKFKPFTRICLISRSLCYAGLPFKKKKQQKHYQHASKGDSFVDLELALVTRTVPDTDVTGTGTTCRGIQSDSCWWGFLLVFLFFVFQWEISETQFKQA